MTGPSDLSIMPPARRFEIAPWGALPAMKSRIMGLGGAGAELDPACVFETASMVFEPGPVTILVEITGFSGSFAFMFLELTNHSIVDGSPRTRLQLNAVELHADCKEAQRYEVAFTAHAHIAYKISGYIHGDTPLKAKGLSVASDTPLTILPSAKKQRSRKDLHGR